MKIIQTCQNNGTFDAPVLTFHRTFKVYSFGQFQEYLRVQLGPNLQDKTVVIMDRASYHMKLAGG